MKLFTFNHRPVVFTPKHLFLWKIIIRIEYNTVEYNYFPDNRRHSEKILRQYKDVAAVG
jgi:hypothetical protein